MKEFHWCDLDWDERVFPDVKGMLKRYHDRGLKICCWINPYVAQGNDFFREGAKKGYFLMRADGKGVKQAGLFPDRFTVRSRRTVPVRKKEGIAEQPSLLVIAAVTFVVMCAKVFCDPRKRASFFYGKVVEQVFPVNIFDLG